MAIKTTYGLRINTFTDTFADAAQRGYLDHLALRDAIDGIDDTDNRYEELHELRNRCLISGVQTIVFSAMCFESAIYEYAATYLGDKYVQEHLDKVDLLSKWVICLRLIADYEIAKDRAPYAALKRLIKARNRLVHSKSEPVDPSNRVAQLTRLRADKVKLTQDIDNAFRAIVLMSAELERTIGLEGSPLPHFNSKIVSTLRIPAPLKPIIDDCRHIVFGRNKRGLNEMEQ